MLTRGLVQDIYTVSAAMSTRDSRCLTIKAHAEPTEGAKVAKLAHWARCAKDIVSTGEANGNGALDTSMSGRTIRSEARSLHGENLIRSELLLIKCLLLLLQSFDLLLNGDL